MQDLDDTELDELAALLDATPEPLQPLDLPMLDGYLAGMLVQPRLVPRDEWLPPVFDFERRPLPAVTDAGWRTRIELLVERRRAALAEAIVEEGCFDPIVPDPDALPPASEYDAVQSPVSRTLLPWAAGFAWALECFPGLEARVDDEVDAAIARILRHLPPQNDDERAGRDALDRAQPLADLDAAIDDLVGATVELWDLGAERRLAVAPIRRNAPKVGRNDPCPCGSGKKFKACHGK